MNLAHMSHVKNHNSFCASFTTKQWDMYPESPGDNNLSLFHYNPYKRIV